MAEFANIDYAEIEALWKQNRTHSGRIRGQLVGLERGVPVRLSTRANVTNPQSRTSLLTNVRNAMKKLGYEDWAEVMVVIHEGQVIVCRPFAEAPKRGPTLREIDRPAP